MTSLDLALIAVSSLGALIYGLIYLEAQTSLTRSLIKTLPLVGLAFIAWLHQAPWLLVAALGLSALGDLALSRAGQRAFMVGLGSFLLAHLAYIVLFVTEFDSWRLDHSLVPASITLLVLGFAVPAIVPHAPEGLRAAVLAYCLVIGAMLFTALNLTADATLLAFGASLFAFSDLILGLSLFRAGGMSDRGKHMLSHLVWWAYIGAQSCLFMALA